MTTRSIKTPATTSMMVAKRPVTSISRAVVGARISPAELSRATNVAGADLAKDSALSKISVSRALFLTALGAVGGAVAAKLAKKPLGIGAGIGASVGGAGSIAQNMLGDGDQSVVTDAQVISTADSAGKGGMTILTVAPKKTRGIPKQTRGIPKQTRGIKSFLITEAKHEEPIGWLAAVVAHGGAVQAGMLKYCQDHSNHVLPHLKLTPPGGPYGSWTRSYSYWTLLTERFMEMPSPVFANFRPPMITYDVPLCNGSYPGEDIQHVSGRHRPKDHPIIWGSVDIEEAIGNVAWAASLGAYQQYTKVYSYIHCDADQYFAQDELDDLGADQYKFENNGWFPSKGIKPAKNIERWIKYSEVKRRFSGKNLTRDQYRDAVKRYYSRNGLSYALSVHPISGAYYFEYPRIRNIPTYWNQSKQRRTDWMNRLDHFYMNCNWLVWAGEMLRLHSKKEVWKGVLPNSRWRDHLLLWGVGRPNKGQTNDRRNMREYDWGTTLDNPFVLEYTKQEVEEILKAIMYHTPPPCDYRFQGNQIAALGQPKMMMDIPDAAGSLQLPVRMDGWVYNRGLQIGGSAGTFDPFALGFQVVASAVGGAAGGVVSIGSSILFTTIAQVVQRAYDMAIKGMLTGKRFSGADVVGLVGDLALSLANQAGAEAAAAVIRELEKQGVNVDIEALRQQFGSILSASEVEGALINIEAQYHILRDVEKWDFLDSAFAGLMSDEVAKAVR